MKRVRRAIGGVKALLRSRRVEQELDEELREYLDAAAAEKIRRGMAPAEALRAARLELGGLEAVKELTRDVGWETRLERAWRDLRYAARRLRKAPAFTTAAALTLALGIGATTAIFSAINAIILRKLPVERPDELVALSVMYPGGPDPVFSYAAYRRVSADAAAVVDAMAASTVRRDAIAIDGAPVAVGHQWVSGNYFTTLGVPAAAGRVLLPADDRPPPGEPVAVLSHAFWTRHFGQDPTTLGRSFRLRGATFTIVGVAAPWFPGDSPGESVDLWMPLTSQPGTPGWVWAGHSTTWLRVLARVREGIGREEARAALEAVYGRIRDDVAAGTDSAEFRASVLASRLAVLDGSGGSSRARDNLSTPLLLLMAIAGLVLVVACANVATLLLARGAAKRREDGLCLAIGAGRMRLVRQRLSEAVLLAAIGGVTGILLAAWGSSVLADLVSGTLPLTLDVSPDVRVFAFAALVSSATALAAGIAPALRASRVDPLAVLKTAGASEHAPARMPLGRLLVITQIAVSLVLLVLAGVFVRSLVNLRSIETGFDADGVLLFRLAQSADEPAVPAGTRRRQYQDLLLRAGRTPGVEGVSASFTGVFARDSWRNAISVEGFAAAPGVTPRTFVNAVTPAYFDVMRIAVLRGRPLSEADDDDAGKAAVVNETFVSQYFAGRDPLGQHVALCPRAPCRPDIEIVGIAEDAKYADLREDRRAMLYLPLAQVEHTPREVQVRTAADPSTVAGTLFRELSASPPPVVAVSGARDQLDASIAGDRLVARLAGFFGVLALLLATIGLYGLIAYVTAQRTGEFGLRIALGADHAEVRRLVMRDTLRVALAGVLIGVPAALACTRLLASQLYLTTPADPAALSIGVSVLMAAACVAGYLPALRAMRVDPAVALRSE